MVAAGRTQRPPPAMFFTSLLNVVFKTTGGRAWNPPGGLRPLTLTQKRNRKKSVEQTLKNLSVLKLAAAHQPRVPVRLYKPLNHARLTWMKKRLEEARKAMGWDLQSRPLQLQARAAAQQLHQQQQSLGPGRPAAQPSLLPPSAQAALTQQHAQGRR